MPEKSTVMNCLNGSDTGGMEGSIEYKGIDLIKKFSQMKWIIGSVPQENIFNEEMTVEEQLIMEQVDCCRKILLRRKSKIALIGH